MTPNETTVLIVDDEPSLRSIFESWFLRLGYQVLTAEDGAQAVEWVKSRKIDVLISDIRMPVMDGIALVRHLHKGTDYVPKIILVSGFSDLTPREAYALGVESMLSKPIRRSELVSAVENLMKGPSDRWSNLPDLAPRLEINQRYESVEVALRKGQIAFGRGGICLHVWTTAREDELLGLELYFDKETKKLDGYGILRWKDIESETIGIEISSIMPESMSWVSDQFQTHQSSSYIPADVIPKLNPGF